VNKNLFFFCNLKKNYPKKTIAQYVGENSPNLVALFTAKSKIVELGKIYCRHALPISRLLGGIKKQRADRHEVIIRRYRSQEAWTCNKPSYAVSGRVTRLGENWVIVYFGQFF
jgi:hypothetical protein